MTSRGKCNSLNKRGDTFCRVDVKRVKSAAGDDSFVMDRRETVDVDPIDSHRK